MTFKSNLHSLTLVLLASASTLALAQGVHLGGGAAVGATGTLQRPAVPAAVSATPATPAVPASNAQTAISGDARTAAGMLTGTVHDAGGTAHGAANAAVTDADATAAMPADGAQADAQGGVAAASKELKGVNANGMAAGKTTLTAGESAKADGNGAAHRSQKKARKSPARATPMSGEANAELGTSTNVSVRRCLRQDRPVMADCTNG